MPILAEQSMLFLLLNIFIYTYIYTGRDFVIRDNTGLRPYSRVRKTTVEYRSFEIWLPANYLTNPKTQRNK